MVGLKSVEVEVIVLSYLLFRLPAVEKKIPGPRRQAR